MIMKTIQISRRIVVSYAMKQGIPFEFDGKSMETKATLHDQNFPMEGKPLQNKQ